MKKTLTTVLYLFFSVQVQAWTVVADFEKGIVGEKANGSDGFTGAFKYTKYADEVTHTGKGAAIVGIPKGDTGWGKWGGSFKYPEPLYEGGEVWFRVWAYFPNGFSFNCGGCAQGMKYIRIHVASAAGKNMGYHSILVKDRISVGSEVTGEVFHSNNAGKKSVGNVVTTGNWQAYELYVKFSSVPGKGIYRVWQDGRLVFEDKVTRTLRTATSKSDYIYLFTYWNNGAPKTQSAYVDDIIITSVQPGDTDSHGNSFIGVGDQKLVSPPRAPMANIRANGR